MTPSDDGQSRDNRCDGCHRDCFCRNLQRTRDLDQRVQDLGALAVHATRSIRILPT